jgi:DNA-binding MarR family transcriptional regulator
MKTGTFGRTLGMRLRRAYLSFHRRANAHLERWGVTADQFVVLRLIAESAGLRQAEIAERASSDANTVGAILRKLQAKGLLRRLRQPGDKRARRVVLTPKGRRMQRRLFARSAKLRRDLDNLFSRSERRVLGTLLARVPPAMGADRQKRIRRPFRGERGLR